MTFDAGPSTDARRSGEPKRVAPRSPRAALEPEYVPEPTRPSRRARHPIVIAGNAIFVGVYYSLQRLCKARMYSDRLSAIHFWGWQLVIVTAALTLPLGFTTSKEYAELEWPIDLLITTGKHGALVAEQCAGGGHHGDQQPARASSGRQPAAESPRQPPAAAEAEVRLSQPAQQGGRQRGAGGTDVEPHVPAFVPGVQAGHVVIGGQGS